MKATIKRDGNLEIKAETELEAYALLKWNDDNAGRERDGIKFTIDCSFTPDNSED